MIKKILKAGFLALFAIALVAIPSKQAEAASWLSGTKPYYSNYDSNGDANREKLFTRATTPGKNAYIWTNNHTKHLHNLKNYPHTTWYSGKGIKKGSAIYYYIHNESNSAKGLVWSGYLRQYTPKTADNFKSGTAFVNYMMTAPDQKLARAILKQLPGIPVSYELSKYAAHQYAVFPKSISGFDDITPISTISLPASDFPKTTFLHSSFGSKLFYYWMATYGQTVAPRAAKVQEAMNIAGLKLSDYNGAGTKWRIGIEPNDGYVVGPTLILARQTN